MSAAAAREPILRCEGVGFSYADGTWALDRVDLEIERGERVAIVGPNGSGKTTLVRLWNGLLRPTNGRVLLDGVPTKGRRVAELARTVGLAFQEPDDQLFRSTVRAEVEFGAQNVGLRGDELRRATDEALAPVGLAGHATSNPFDLGGSQRRLLVLACVLAMQTPLVVLDEPTIGLDREEVARVKTIVESLARDGRTVVAITHDQRFLANTFDRTFRLDAGRAAVDVSPRVR